MKKKYYIVVDDYGYDGGLCIPEDCELYETLEEAKASFKKSTLSDGEAVRTFIFNEKTILQKILNFIRFK